MCRVSILLTPQRPRLLTASRVRSRLPLPAKPLWMGSKSGHDPGARKSVRSGNVLHQPIRSNLVNASPSYDSAHAGSGSAGGATCVGLHPTPKMLVGDRPHPEIPAFGPEVSAETMGPLTDIQDSAQTATLLLSDYQGVHRVHIEGMPSSLRMQRTTASSQCSYAPKAIPHRTRLMLVDKENDNLSRDFVPRAVCNSAITDLVTLNSALRSLCSR